MSLDADINIRTAKAAAIMSKLNRKVWTSDNLTEKTKLHVYQARVLSTLLNSSEAYKMCARQEKKLNSFHLRCLRRILGISWQDRATKTEVLECAHSSGIYTLLSQRGLRWLGHIHRMADGRIPKYFQYGEIVIGTRSTGRPCLRYKDTCKRDMKMVDIDTNSWETGADGRGHWMLIVWNGVRKAEHKISG